LQQLDKVSEAIIYFTKNKAFKSAEKALNHLVALLIYFIHIVVEGDTAGWAY
jgi:hypothetical protein